jgi:hypothetical protein
VGLRLSTMLISNITMKFAHRPPETGFL